jgi:hypothetical protein
MSRSRSLSQRVENTDSVNALKSFYARRKYSTFIGDGSSGHRSSKRRKTALNDATNRSSYEYKCNDEQTYSNDPNNAVGNRNNSSNKHNNMNYECKYSDDDDMLNGGMPLITPRFNNQHLRQQRMEEQVCSAPRKQRKSYVENIVPDTARLLSSDNGNRGSRYSNNPNSAKSICAQLRIAEMERNTVMENDDDESMLF